jgi:hypothetical protein
MNTDELLKIAASLARGVDPDTGAPLEEQRVAVPPKVRGIDPVFSISKEQQALVRSVAEANSSGTLLLDESEFLSKKRAEFLPSLNALGAEDGERWLLVKLQWTVEYWRARAIRAEARLRVNT